MKNENKEAFTLASLREKEEGEIEKETERKREREFPNQPLCIQDCQALACYATSFLSLSLAFPYSPCLHARASSSFSPSSLAMNASFAGTL